MWILNEFGGELVVQNRDSKLCSTGINTQGRLINIVQTKLGPSTYSETRASLTLGRYVSGISK